MSDDEESRDTGSRRYKIPEGDTVDRIEFNEENDFIF